MEKKITPIGAWPKPYLLQLYEQAMTEGAIRVRLDGNEEQFKSLKAAFYRLRRRADKQHASFIKPEYHLITVSWEADRGGALITYNKLADGASLPVIESVEGKIIEGMENVKPLAGPVTPEAEPFDSVKLIDGLLADARRQISAEDIGD